MGFQNVAVGRINGVVSLTGLSYKKMYGCFAWTKKGGCNNEVTVRRGSTVPNRQAFWYYVMVWFGSIDLKSHPIAQFRKNCIINRAAMGRARFMVYPWFFFFDFCASRPKLPLGQILSHATCDVYSQKAVETLINLIFRGKKLKTQRSSKILFFHQKFSSEHIHVYIRLNRRWNDLFRIFFPSGSTETSNYKITPNLLVAKKSLQNPDFEAI